MNGLFMDSILPISFANIPLIQVPLSNIILIIYCLKPTWENMIQIIAIIYFNNLNIQTSIPFQHHLQHFLKALHYHPQYLHIITRPPLHYLQMNHFMSFFCQYLKLMLQQNRTTTILKLGQIHFVNILLLYFFFILKVL